MCVCAALPYSLQFVSEPVSRYANRYTLQWTVSSYSPLLDFALKLRQVGLPVLAMSSSLLASCCIEFHLLEIMIYFAVSGFLNFSLKPNDYPAADYSNLQ